MIENRENNDQQLLKAVFAAFTPTPNAQELVRFKECMDAGRGVGTERAQGVLDVLTGKSPALSSGHTWKRAVWAALEQANIPQRCSMSYDVLNSPAELIRTLKTRIPDFHNRLEQVEAMFPAQANAASGESALHVIRPEIPRHYLNNDIDSIKQGLLRVLDNAGGEMEVQTLRKMMSSRDVVVKGPDDRINPCFFRDDDIVAPCRAGLKVPSHYMTFSEYKTSGDKARLYTPCYSSKENYMEALKQLKKKAYIIPGSDYLHVKLTTKGKAAAVALPSLEKADYAFIRRVAPVNFDPSLLVPEEARDKQVAMTAVAEVLAGFSGRGSRTARILEQIARKINDPGLSRR